MALTWVASFTVRRIMEMLSKLCFSFTSAAQFHAGSKLYARERVAAAKGKAYPSLLAVEWKQIGSKKGVQFFFLHILMLNIPPFSVESNILQKCRINEIDVCIWVAVIFDFNICLYLDSWFLSGFTDSLDGQCYSLIVLLTVLMWNGVYWIGFQTFHLQGTIQCKARGLLFICCNSPCILQNGAISDFNREGKTLQGSKGLFSDTFQRCVQEKERMQMDSRLITVFIIH